MKIKPIVYHVSLAAYCLFIFILSSIPGENFPELDFKFSDKLVHLVVYGILFLLFFYSLKNQTKSIKLQKNPLEYSVLFTALYGITDEIHQYFVPNRSCELSDWIADIAGALIVFIGMKIYFTKNRNLIAALVVLSFFGCSAEQKINRNEKPEIKITEAQAWLNLMPVIGSLSNILGFSVSADIKGTKNKNLSVKDLNIILDKDTLYNKQFILDETVFADSAVKIIFHQSNQEK